ncbi:HBS1-like protein [Ophiocordyceps camponoti-floridani]|uniref:HBS1-like protein n=1 Tax=Ophiocordyceps camponoti-floridani TaxID=2030778 RepID=A0A8H4QEA7_9HYPO|nr:HBS1-like protein [Ophiocordyceps camponoti-floridani]
MSRSNLYEDDLVDHDDCEGQDDELSPEDQVAMSLGTSEVRAALGNDAKKVTVSQIQEALWYYYFDVDKSVSYLNKTFIQPPPKPAPKKTADGPLEQIKSVREKTGKVALVLDNPHGNRHDPDQHRSATCPGCAYPSIDEQF